MTGGRCTHLITSLRSSRLRVVRHGSEELINTLACVNSWWRCRTYSKRNYSTSTTITITVTLEDAYSILGVDSETPPNMIRDAYLALVKEFHPDRSSSKDHDKFVKVMQYIYQRDSTVVYLHPSVNSVECIKVQHQPQY